MMVAALTVVCWFVGAQGAVAADRAVIDTHFQLNWSDPVKRAAGIRDFRDLHTRWVRIDLSWSALEPAPGAYDLDRLALLDTAVDELREAGIRVMFTVYAPPDWAADTSYGGPVGAGPPIREDAIDDFGRFGEFLASHFAGRVRALECWCTRTTRTPPVAQRAYSRRPPLAIRPIR